jgi:membrane-associated phospholipid phosphatase
MTTRYLTTVFASAILASICACSATRAQEEVAAATAPPAASAMKESPSPINALSQGNTVARTFVGTQLGLVGRLLDDQREIWRSPTRIRFSATEWLVPLGGITAGLFATDRDFSKHLSQNPSTISHYKTLSNGGVAALIGGAGGMWLLGHAKHNEHWSETGFLAGEAALNSLVVVEGLKYSLGRDRPFQGDGSGPFFRGGTSFPSEHSAAAWSVAGVIAHEYPGPLTKITAYGLASLVSVSRVKAHQHFPSDVLVGGVIGNLVAQNIYSRHHDSEVGGGEWRPISQFFRGERSSSPANQGSPYVPLDSWVYSALDRLATLDLVQSGFAGMRPWTHLECARLVNEANDSLQDHKTESAEATRLLEALEQEFVADLEELGGGENFRLRPESIYTRFTGISGPPLRDGTHFGQTIINDYGRPFAEGMNNVTGFSGWASVGRFAFYIRGEYEHAGFFPALSDGARALIARKDGTPEPPSAGTPTVNQFRLLDGYVAMNFENWQVSFGKQSLWWGPGDGGAMLFSNNAQPINMFRINRVSPVKLPGIFSRLGPMRTEFFLGQLAGYEFVLSPLGLIGQYGQALNPQPFLHGQKISFKPTPNLEFGVSRTTIYGGPGYPFTPHTFLRSLFSTGNEIAGTPLKPGDRRSGVDLSYRLPGLRKWLTFYADGFTDDEISPIGYADRSAWRAGLYLSQFPRFQKLDLRVEGVYTDNPLGGALCCGFFYANGTWRSGYRNNGNLIGSWIGREGQGAQAWATYWLTPKNKILFNYRHQKVNPEFIPGGGTLTDAGVHADLWMRANCSVSGFVQYEVWNYPILAQGSHRVVTSSLQLTYWPRGWPK